MTLEFKKMEGAGNDFVVIDNRAGVIKDGSAAARTLCNRHSGVGADGLLLLEESSKADFRMMYYNADGSYGGMCGNGGRCIALFASELGLTGEKTTFEALDFVYSAEMASDGSVSVGMKDPSALELDIVLPTSQGELRVHFVDTGSPHVVVFVDDLAVIGVRDIDQVPISSLGQDVRAHKRFQPAGANVNFVHPTSNNTLKIRSYERGVEAETMACGTGSIAAAIIGMRKRGMTTPIRITPASGQEMTVSFVEKEGTIRGVRLKGPARTVFRGTVEFDERVV